MRRVGPISGGGHVFLGFLGDSTTNTAKLFALTHNASVNVGKFVYRML